MIYIIYGEEKYLATSEFNKILNQNKDANIIQFEGFKRDINIKEIVYECQAVDIFSTHKVVVVRDPIFFVNKCEDLNLNLLIDYCKNPEFDTDLIFYSINKNFNEKLNTFKEIKSNAQVIKCSKVDQKNFNTYAIELIKKYNLKIDKEAIDFIIKDNNTSLDLLNNNLKTLALYPDNITIDVVKNMITYSDEENVFLLINAIIEKNLSKAISLSRKIINTESNTSNELGIISLLATQLRFIYCVLYYESINYSSKEIADLLNCKEARVYNTIRNSRDLTLEKILKLQNELSNLDMKIKLSSLGTMNEFELFLVKYIKG